MTVGQPHDIDLLALTRAATTEKTGVIPVGAQFLSPQFKAPAGAAADANGVVIDCNAAWIAYTYAGACAMKYMAENRANTGEFANLRLRARAYNTTESGNGGNSVGTTTCADFSASAQKAEYGNLRAVNAVAQPNAFAQSTDPTNIVSALYGRIDATAASVGRRWVSWLDTHATTKADASDYLQRISHNGTAALDGMTTIYNGGRLPIMFNFEDVAGFLSTSGSGTFTKTHKLAMKIAGDATQYYIEMGTIA